MRNYRLARIGSMFLSFGVGGLLAQWFIVAAIGASPSTMSMVCLDIAAMLVGGGLMSYAARERE